MLVDVACAVVLIAFAILGAWRGLIRQVFSLLAVVMIALFAVPVGVAVAGPIAEGWGPGAATKLKIGLSLGAALAIYIFVKLIGGAADHAIGRRRAGGGESQLAPWNRYWGAALSVVKAALLCWLIVCFFTAFPDLAPGATARVRKSWSGRTTQLFNPFERWIGSETRLAMRSALVDLWKLKRYPAAYRKVIREESIQRVLEHKRIRELLDEGKGNIIAALASREFRESLSDVDWAQVADVTREALAEAEKE